MKRITCFLWLLLSPVMAWSQEKIEILLVGTQHEFVDSLKHLQQFEQINQRLVQFAPDIICIESVPVSDAASLREVRSDQLQVAQQMRDEKGLSTFGLQTKIDRLKTRLKTQPDDLVVQSTLANYLYAYHDFWNAYYHYFRLYTALKQSSEVDEALKATFALDSIHVRVTERQRNGEYHNIVYPVAQQLGLMHLENIDYRADEDEFLKRLKKAAIGTIFNLKVFRLKKLMKKMQSEMSAAEQRGELMDHINSSEQQAFYLDLIDNAHKFKKSKNMRTAVELWEFRNEVMTMRIMEAIERNKARKVLVTFGAFHVPFVKRYLERHNFKVTTYSEYMSQFK